MEIDNCYFLLQSKVSHITLQDYEEELTRDAIMYICAYACAQLLLVYVRLARFSVLPLSYAVPAQLQPLIIEQGRLRGGTTHMHNYGAIIIVQMIHVP